MVGLMMLDGSITPRDRLIVALDVPTIDEARELISTIGEAATFYKIGLELVLSGGLSFVRELVSSGHRVFLDMKLLDIENTVQKSVAAAARTGATFLTVHAVDMKTLRAAAAGCDGTSLKVLGVTVLTNIEAPDLVEQGLSEPPEDVVLRRAELAARSGIAGVIASGREAAAVRAVLGPGKFIVTPGIRRAQDAPGDQARVTTPADAIEAGADYLVVGRPITGSADPKAAAAGFVAEIEAALDAQILNATNRE